MNQNKIKNQDYIKKQTAISIAAATFILGFVFGTVLTVYKSVPSSGPARQSGNTAQHQEAVESINKMIKQRPDDPNLWAQLGHAYFDANQYANAIQAYNKSLSIKADANVSTDLGVMYRRNEQPEKAIEAFDNAVRIDPSHETARFNKGIVLLHDLKQTDKALQSWEDLLKINPAAMAPNGQSVDELVRHYKEHVK